MPLWLDVIPGLMRAGAHGILYGHRANAANVATESVMRGGTLPSCPCVVRGGDYSGTHSKSGKNATIEMAGRSSIIYVTLRWNYGAILPGMLGSMLRDGPRHIITLHQQRITRDNTQPWKLPVVLKL